MAQTKADDPFSRVARVDTAVVVERWHLCWARAAVERNVAGTKELCRWCGRDRRRYPLVALVQAVEGRGEAPVILSVDTRSQRCCIWCSARSRLQCRGNKGCCMGNDGCSAQRTGRRELQTIWCDGRKSAVGVTQQRIERSSCSCVKAAFEIASVAGIVWHGTGHTVQVVDLFEHVLHRVACRGTATVSAARASHGACHSSARKRAKI